MGYFLTRKVRRMNPDNKPSIGHFNISNSLPSDILLKNNDNSFFLFRSSVKDKHMM